MLPASGRQRQDPRPPRWTKPRVRAVARGSWPRRAESCRSTAWPRRGVLASARGARRAVGGEAPNVYR